MERDVILSVRDLDVKFTLRSRVLHAIRGVSLDVYRGESLAIVGESGSGKSVFTKTFMGLTDQNGYIDAGSILYDGKDLAAYQGEKQWRTIRGGEIAMVLQDPMTSLNPLKTIGRQIEEAVILHQHLRGAEARRAVLETLSDVGIDDPERRYKQYPHEFSGGMRQRVVIAIALAANPKLIIADEPTTALDVTVQAQILALMENLVKRFGSALILITHDLAVVSEMTHRVAVMYCGRVVEEGPTRELVRHPFHPYTKGLLESIPRLSGERSRRLPQIPGMVPSLFDLPPGCSFAPRCGYATDLCRHEAPRMRAVAPGRMVSCHNPVQGGEEAEGHGR